MTIKSSAEYFPNNRAMIYMDKSFTYTHLLKRINQFAFALKEIGVKKDDVITICLPNIPDAIYLLYAVNQIGAIANLVHPLFTYKQMKENFVTTKSKYLFALDSRFNDFERFSKEGINVHFANPVSELSLLKRLGYKAQSKKYGKIPLEMSMAGFYNAPCLTSFDERYECDAIYLHSGGTSGKPKIIALSSFALNALVAQGPWIINRDTCEGIGMLAVLPMFHGFGLCIGIHIALSDGGFDVLMPKFSAKETIKYIKKNQLHVLIGVPTLYEALCNKEEFSGDALKNIIIAWVGGDFIPNALLKHFNQRMIDAGAEGRIRPGYGLTETVNVCAVNSVSHFKEGTVGTNLPNVKFLIVDSKNKPLNANEEGELLVGGETLMNGYRFNDDKDINDNSFVFINGEKYIRTGDICSLDEDGYLTIKSRIKNIIKVNGVPVFPNEIEQSVSDFDYVWECSAVGIPHPRFGHAIKLFIVLNRKKTVDTLKAKEEIANYIVSKHGVYAKPIDIIFLEKMPHTMVGKTDQKKLVEDL